MQGVPIQFSNQCKETEGAREGRITNFKVIRTGRQELIAYMQGLRPVNTPEILLTGTDTPGFIADVDEDVVSTCIMINVSESKETERMKHTVKSAEW